MVSCARQEPYSSAAHGFGPCLFNRLTSRSRRIATSSQYASSHSRAPSAARRRHVPPPILQLNQELGPAVPSLGWVNGQNEGNATTGQPFALRFLAELLPAAAVGPDRGRSFLLAQPHPSLLDRRLACRPLRLVHLVSGAPAGRPFRAENGSPVAC